MSKIEKNNLIELLKNKGNRTFKELSRISGYHEKYLIRIYPLVMENKITANANYKRISPKKIDDDSICNLQNLYKSGNWKTKKEFYNHLKNNKIYTFSYSKVCNILKNTIKYQNTCVFAKYIINGKIRYVAFDYETLKIFFIICDIINNKKAFHILFQRLIMNHGAPNYIACDSLFSYDKKYYDDYLIKFNIKKMNNNYDIKKAIRRVRKKIDFSYQDNFEKKNYKKCKYELISFYPKKMINIDGNLKFQFKNVRYRILNQKISKGKGIAYYDDTYQVKLIEQGNKTSKVEILKRVTSKKGLTKY